MDLTFTSADFAGGVPQNVRVPIIDDAIFEGDEVFLGRLFGSAPRLTVAPDETVITIREDDSE